MTSPVRSRALRTSVAVSLTMVVAFAGALSASAVSPRVTPSFNDPAAIVIAGGHVWVADEGSNALTQLNSAGVVTLHVTAAHGDLNKPQALAGNSTDVFAANHTSTVSEFSATTGGFVRTLSAHNLHLGDPIAMAIVGADLWVVNESTNSLTEIATATGNLVRTVTNQPFGAVAFDGPVAITVAGQNLWIANDGTNSIAEVASRTGSITRVISSSADGFAMPAGVAYDGTHIWVTESATDAVTELMASTGALVQLITNSSLDGGYGFWSPSVIVAGAGVVYVASPPGGSPMITQIATSTGVANWMMCNTNYDFNFLNPDGMAIDAGNLFVANGANNTLSEMNASTGVWIQDVS
jgi:DNA-binding beta-propeller fold protein YncE